jgi:hypothetical protein
MLNSLNHSRLLQRAESIYSKEYVLVKESMTMTYADGAVF